MRRRFEQAAAERIRDNDIARAHRLQQARHAEQRFAAQFERIAKAIVDAAENQIHRFETGQCFQENLIVAGNQIRAFDERKAPVARKERMFEVRFVVRPGREQNNARAAARIRGGMRRQFEQVEQRLALHFEEAIQLPHLAEIENQRQRACAGRAIFERVADAGRRLVCGPRSPTRCHRETAPYRRHSCEDRRLPAA